MVESVKVRVEHHQRRGWRISHTLHWVLSTTTTTASSLVEVTTRPPRPAENWVRCCPGQLSKSRGPARASIGTARPTTRDSGQGQTISSVDRGIAGCQWRSSQTRQRSPVALTSSRLLPAWVAARLVGCLPRRRRAGSEVSWIGPGQPLRPGLWTWSGTSCVVIAASLDLVAQDEIGAGVAGLGDVSATIKPALRI